MSGNNNNRSKNCNSNANAYLSAQCFLKRICEFANNTTNYGAMCKNIYTLCMAKNKNKVETRAAVAVAAEFKCLQQWQKQLNAYVYMCVCARHNNKTTNKSCSVIATTTTTTANAISILKKNNNNCGSSMRKV